MYVSPRYDGDNSMKRIDDHSAHHDVYRISIRSISHDRRNILNARDCVAFRRGKEGISFQEKERDISFAHLHHNAYYHCEVAEEHP